MSTPPRAGRRRRRCARRTPSRTVEAAGPSVRLFEARIARGSLMGARLLLKEYLPAARDVAQQV